MAAYCPSSSLQARIHVAAHGFHLQIGTHPPELRRPPQRAGPYFRSLAQLGQPSAYNCVARIFPLRYRRDLQARRNRGGKILKAVHRQVHLPRQQRFLDFLGEQPLAAHAGKRNAGDPVAGGLDDFDAALHEQRGQASLHPTRLPQRQL